MRDQRICILCILSVLLCLRFPQAQHLFNVKHYTIDQGLPHNIGYKLIQDSKGYMWIGTDDGLVRFDGENFKIYRTSDGLRSNYIIDIVEDKQGTLWVGSWKGGVNCIKNDSVFTPSIDQPMFRIAHIAVNHDQLFLSDSKYEIRHYTNKNKHWEYSPFFHRSFLRVVSVTHPKNNQQSKSKKASLLDTQVHFSENGLPLLFGEFTGVWQYQRDSTFKPFYTQVIQQDTVTHIAQDAQQRYWLGTRGKIIMIDAQRYLSKVYKNLPNESIYNIKIMPSGKIYFLTNYHQFNQRGVYSYDLHTGAIIDIKKKLGLKVAPSAIETDREGNLWLTTNGEGVYCITPSLFTNYQRQSGLPNVFIRGIKADSSGNIYVGTINGLVRYQAGKFMPQSLHPQNVPYEVLHMFSDHHKNVLVSTLVKSRNTQGSYLYKVANQVSKKLYNASFYNQSYLDSQNRLWSFTEERLFWYTYSSNLPLRKTFYPKFKSGLIVSQIFEYTGKYWIASNQGLLTFEEYTNKKKQPNLRFVDTLNTANGLSSNHINVVKKGRGGELWIGTKEGLCKLYKGKITCFNHAKDGLVSNNCTSLEIDQYGRVWIGTPKGLSCFDGHSFINYNHKTGLVASDINCLFVSKQQLWVGTSQGVSVLDLSRTLKKTAPSKIYIKHIKLNGVLQNSQSAIEATYPSNLKIYCNTLSYTYPEGVRYQYRLNNGAWQNINQPLIEYNAFKKGSYIFEIRVKKFDSGWSKPQTILLIVHPPVWFTWWAISLYILGGLCLMLAGIKWRSTRLEREKQKLEQVVKQRTQELTQQKEEMRTQAEKLSVLNQVQSNFFAGISHELRTPLTLIVEPAEKLLQYHQEQSSQKYTQTILNNTQRLLRLINQLMDFTKLESGKMTLQLETHNLYQLLVYVVSSFELLAQQKNIDLKLTATNKTLYYQFDQDHLEKIFFNLISNALKFTPAKGSVTIHMWPQEGVNISITDTGIGIAAGDLPHVFDRFYQIDGSNTRRYAGTGIGLALARELAELHGGSIEVTSIPDQGSSFLVKLPLVPGNANEAIATNTSSQVVQNIQSSSKKLENLSPELNITAEAKNQFTILVTEDNSELRKFICAELATTYHILEASDGAEGIDKAIKQMPDLIITDVMMPQVDGFELVKTLRQNLVTSHIPIIILSARASLESRLKGLEMGSDDYLIKPFNAQELLLKVRNILARKEKLWKAFQQSLAKPETPIALSKVANNPMDEALLQKAIEIVEAHLNDTTFDVSVFCKAIGISRSGLHQKIKALTNMSTTEFIRSIKLKKAALLIKQQNGRIEDIAFQVGFNDLSYFNRCFKKQFGLTPKKYRQHHT